MKNKRRRYIARCKQANTESVIYARDLKSAIKKARKDKRFEGKSFSVFRKEHKYI